MEHVGGGPDRPRPGLAGDDTVIEVRGFDLATTKKFRDVARTGRAAIVIDELASFSPWQVRGIEVRGSAEALTEPEPRIRIHPERIISWGLAAPRNARTVNPGG